MKPEEFLKTALTALFSLVEKVFRFQHPSPSPITILDLPLAYAENHDQEIFLFISKNYFQWFRVQCFWAVEFVSDFFFFSEKRREEKGHREFNTYSEETEIYVVYVLFHYALSAEPFFGTGKGRMRSSL